VGCHVTTKDQLPSGWFVPLGWILAVLSVIGNLVILSYVLWIRSLSGAAYAQADLGLFMLLAFLGTPIVLASIGILILGWLLSHPKFRFSAGGLRNPLVLVLLGNVGFVGIFWIYLFFLA